MRDREQARSAADQESEWIAGRVALDARRPNLCERGKSGGARRNAWELTTYQTAQDRPTKPR